MTDPSDLDIIASKPSYWRKVEWISLSIQVNVSGMLIDLGLAKELDTGPSEARHRTGTMEFMGIEILKGKARTYRHDPESLFYIFI
jgi:Fungal protein kinase